MSKSSILITGARSAAAFDWARRWCDAGYDVHMADCSSALIVKLSKLEVKIHKYKPPRLDYRAFEKDIIGLVCALKPTLVIPTCEEVFYLSKIWSDHKMTSPLFAPGQADLIRLHRKDTFVDLCKNLKIAVPETVPYSPQTALDVSPNGWVFKLVFSRFGTGTYIDTAPPQDKMHQKSGDPQLWVRQKKIDGQEVSLYAICKNGNIIGFSAYDSEWRLPGGASYAFHNTEPSVQVQLLKYAAALAKNLNLTGQIGCDAIIDDAGKAWLIECNPRATSGIHLLEPGSEWLEGILKSAPKHCAKQLDQDVYLEPALFSFGYVSARREGRTKSWRCLLKTGKGVLKSRGAIIGAILDSFAFACLGMRKQISLKAATTYDIEWNVDCDQ